MFSWAPGGPTNIIFLPDANSRVYSKKIMLLEPREPGKTSVIQKTDVSVTSSLFGHAIYVKYETNE